MSSFKEFYLSPSHGIKCAWSSYSPLLGTARPSLLNVGLKNITFSTNTAYLVVPYTGIYYISITTTNLNSGSAVNFRVHINVTGTYPYPEIFTCQGTNSCATRSSSSLLHLQANGTVIATIPAGSSYQPHSTFCGFLLYPL